MALKILPQTPTFDFMRRRHWAMLFSACLLLATVALVAIKGLAFGIDFTGGTLIQLQIPAETSITQVRSQLEEADFAGVTLQEFGGENELLLRLPNKVEATEITQLIAGSTLRRSEFVGPQIGAELRTTGLLALLAALGAILVYVTLRFEFRYGVGAIVALFHDVMLTVGYFSLVQKEISMPVLAALLTVIGYSLNDSIVVFDRIRENRGRHAKTALADVINLSLNQTLSRTIMTSLTTLLVVLALVVVGGDVIHDFALTLMVGVIVGTYSSVFVASPVLLALEGWYQRMAAADEENKTAP